MNKVPGCPCLFYRQGPPRGSGIARGTWATREEARPTPGPGSSESTEGAESREGFTVLEWTGTWGTYSSGTVTVSVSSNVASDPVAELGPTHTRKAPASAPKVMSRR